MALAKFLLAYLVASQGISKTEAEEFITKLEEGDEETEKDLLNNHKARVSELKRTAFDDGHKKAAKNTLTKLEADLKEKFGIESDKQGIELVEEVVAAKAAGSESKDITEEDVKKSPVYLALEKEKKQAEKRFETDLQNKVKEVEEGYAKQATVKAVAEKAITQFMALNPVLAADATKAERQKALIRKQIESGSYKVEGENILILNADGSRLEDDHGNAIKFEDYVKNTADELGFEFKVADQRDSSGGGSNGGAGGLGNQGGTGSEKKYTGKLPTNEDEYTAILFNSALSIEQKNEVQEHWNKSQSST